MLADLGDGKCGDTDEDAQPTMVRAGTKMTGSKAAALGAGSKPESEIRGWGTAPMEADHPSDARLRETIATAHMASMGKAKLLQPSAYSYVLIECCAIALDMHIGHSECAYWCACAINNLASFARLCAVTQIERRVERRIEIRDAVAGGDSEVMEQLDRCFLASDAVAEGAHETRETQWEPRPLPLTCVKCGVTRDSYAAFTEHCTLFTHKQALAETPVPDELVDPRLRADVALELHELPRAVVAWRDRVYTFLRTIDGAGMANMAEIAADSKAHMESFEGWDRENAVWRRLVRDDNRQRRLGRLRLLRVKQ